MTGAPALHVLVAEDEEHLGAILETFLVARGHRVLRVRDGRAAVDALGRERWDVALLDVMMPELDGLEVLRSMAGDAGAPQAVVMTGNATVDVALSALQLGAYDYITKPYRMAEVDALVRRAAEKGALRRELALLRCRLAQADAPVPFVTRHPSLLAVVAGADAPRPAPLVAALGEAGAGRRTLLRWLHAAARPHAPPPVELTCAGDAAADDAALFGAPFGSGSAVGALETAEGGAVLLRRAERLAPSTAARLAAALAEGGFARGDGRIVPLRARPLLAAAVDDGVAALAGGVAGARVVEVPPLRERPVDILPLADHFLRAAARDAAARPLALGDDAAAWLEAQPWPGNAVELRRVVELAAWRAAGAGDGRAGAAGGRPLCADSLREAAAIASRAAPGPPAATATENREPDQA